MEASHELRAIPIHGIGEVRPADDLTDVLLKAFAAQISKPQAGDILVIKHKIVSKAEGRLVALDSVKPSEAAEKWAADHGLDGRVVELALRESVRIVRQQNGVLITETGSGLICANSGVDVSNVDGGTSAVLLPSNPDDSAHQLYCELQNKLGFCVPVIISDSFGRPWREGLCDVAIGVAGMKPLSDFRGQHDPHGYELHASVEAVADELAAMAGLACGKLTGTPACIIRGFAFSGESGSARELVRPAERDLFR